MWRFASITRIVMLGIVLFGFSGWCRCDSAAPMTQYEGFTADTQLQIWMTEYDIFRFSWELIVGGSYVSGKVILSQGETTAGNDNKVMIYGDRTAPLVTDEPDWSLTPRPLNIFFASEQVEYDLRYYYGPKYVDLDSLSWYQHYLYTACCNLVNGGTARDDKILAVENTL